MRTVNVDMDGVIYDFVGTLTRIAREEMDTERDWDIPEAPPKAWAMWDHWGMSKNQFYKLFDRAILSHGLFQIGDPIPGAIEGMEELSQRFERVRIVTSKQMQTPGAATAAQQQCLAWIARYLDPSKYEVAFTSNKKGYLADVVIDDKPTLEWAQRGALNLLFDQPWNSGTWLEVRGRGGRGMNLYRAYEWKAVPQIIDWWEARS